MPIVLFVGCATKPGIESSLAEGNRATPRTHTPRAPTELCPSVDETEQITWERAVDLIEAGEVNYVGQRHDRTVCLRHLRGATYSSVEPELGDILDVARDAPNWPFPFGTE